MIKAPPDAPWFSTSSGSIEFQITLEDAQCGHHQGPCDNNIEILLTEPYIKTAIEAIDQVLLRKELAEYAAWSDIELMDQEQNKRRILWLACGNITEWES